MKNKNILYLDASINFALGVILLIFSPGLVALLGIPDSSTGFYPNILGAVFIGITIALIIEAIRKDDSAYFVGLGLIGAICINICGGIVLALWLIFGNLNLPSQGNVILWLLALALVVISSIELYSYVSLARRGA
jgi:hypothetical protein